MLNYLIVGILLALTSSLSFGSEAQNGSGFSVSVDEIKRDSEIEISAAAWGVTRGEWLRYEALMKGDAKFQFKNANPLRVLGMYSDDPVERDRYAEMQVRDEYERLKRFLEFNRLYKLKEIAFLKDKPLYDKEHIAKVRALYEGSLGVSSDASQSKGLDPGDVLVIFIDINDPLSRDLFSKVNELRNSTIGAKIDIYFMNSDEAGISAWANEVGIARSMVDRGLITLNADGGSAKKLGVVIGQRKIYVIKNDRYIEFG